MESDENIGNPVDYVEADLLFSASDGCDELLVGQWHDGIEDGRSYLMVAIRAEDPRREGQHMEVLLSREEVRDLWGRLGALLRRDEVLS